MLTPLLRFMLLTGVVLTATACSKDAVGDRRTPTKTSSRPSDDSDDDHAKESGVEHSERQGSVLTLGEDALRDLRLTIRMSEKRPADDTILAPGSLEYSPEAISTLSAPVSGLVTKITKAVGDTVDAGEVLVEFQSAELGKAQLALSVARSRAVIVKGRMDLAKKQLEKVKELASEKMSTVREVQAAELEAATREAEFLDAENNLLEAEQTLALLRVEASDAAGRFALKSSLRGIVTSRDVVPGDWVEPGHLLYRIVDASKLVAVVHPFERDGSRIDSSAKIRLSIAAIPGQFLDATYLRSGPEVDAETRTLPVRLSIVNTDGKLRAGMSVTAEIRVKGYETGDVVSIPIAAIQRVDRNWCVFIPRGNGKFERRVVARGRDLGGEVEILSGLDAGEGVVVEGSFVLRAETMRGEGEGDAHNH